MDAHFAHRQKITSARFENGLKQPSSLVTFYKSVFRRNYFNYISLATVTLQEVPAKPRPGRPRKKPTASLSSVSIETIGAATKHWRVTYSVADMGHVAIEAYLRAQATFALIHTRDATWNMEDREMIPAYRRQYVIEQGFSWLKSTAVINPMYLQTPHHISSLGFIACIGLMAWNLIQRNVRSYLKANKIGLPYHHKKKSDHITTRLLFEHFANLETVTHQHGNHSTKHLVNANGWNYLALQALGISEECIRPVHAPRGKKYLGNS